MGWIKEFTVSQERKLPTTHMSKCSKCLVSTKYIFQLFLQSEFCRGGIFLLKRKRSDWYFKYTKPLLAILSQILYTLSYKASRKSLAKQLYFSLWNKCTTPYWTAEIERWREQWIWKKHWEEATGMNDKFLLSIILAHVRFHAKLFTFLPTSTCLMMRCSFS